MATFGLVDTSKLGTWTFLARTLPNHEFPLPGRRGMSSAAPIRVLVVEDFVPFRREICAMLESCHDLQVIGGVSDGLEAAQKAAELKPDLILLDIGLPNLNGIEAARRIRTVAPESKIIFLTQESSADVVQEALGTGARGYVFKIKAASDLLPAVEAVLKEEMFVSSR
jgi:DNA-binding NarL/FixJ family response regulator